MIKKSPLDAYSRKFSKTQIIGTLADESIRRKQSYMKNNCNGFDMVRPQSRPLSFWTEQDILTYIRDKNIKIADCYGGIVEENGLLKTTKCSRTGCVFCLFGCLSENPDKTPYHENLLIMKKPTQPKNMRFSRLNFLIKKQLL